MYTNFIKEDMRKNSFFALKTQRVLIKSKLEGFCSNECG